MARATKYIKRLLNFYGKGKHKYVYKGKLAKKIVGKKSGAIPYGHARGEKVSYISRGGTSGEGRIINYANDHFTVKTSSGLLKKIYKTNVNALTKTKGGTSLRTVSASKAVRVRDLKKQAKELARKKAGQPTRKSINQEMVRMKQKRKAAFAKSGVPFKKQ